jgi:hypothetical protein
MEAFCENADCRVIMFRVGPKPGEYLDNENNCPDCGRFGRIKDDKVLRESPVTQGDSE